MPYQISPGVNVTEVDLSQNIPGIATTTGAIAGVFRWGPVDERVLIADENSLVLRFGKPSNFNYETFFTAANFLSYTSSLYVVRSANTTTETANSALNAIANSGSATVLDAVVKNRSHWTTTREGHVPAGVEYIAKYPGALGNSLKVSVCDSASAYESDHTLSGNNANVSSNSLCSTTFTTIIGSNSGVFNTTSGSNVHSAEFVTDLSTKFTVGDVIKIGNSSIGTQYLKIGSIGSVSVSSTNSAATFTLTFDSKYRLSTDYVANSSVNGNTVKRNWEYFGITDNAPEASFYTDNFGNTEAQDSLHIVVTDEDGQVTGVPGSVLEVYKNLSRATDAKSQEGASLYYKTVINDGSAYIWAGNDRSNAVSNTAVNVASSTNTKPLTQSFVGGTDGYTEADAPLSLIATGYDMYASQEQADVSIILQGKPTGGSTTVNGMAVAKFGLSNYLIDNIASVRKDCVVIVTPDDAIVRSNPGAEATALVNWFSQINDSSYSVYDSGYKYMYDRYNDVYRYVPLNGDVGGLLARTEATNDAWWSPAGFNRGQVKNIVKLRYSPTKTDRDLLYKNSINPVVTFPGQGTVLFGDKTGTKKPSAFDRVNVRRLFIVLEKAIANASRFSLFEFNDEFTRSQFKNLVVPFLRDIQARRGIQDFLVVCDATNNTAERIDRNEFWGDIYVKPNRSINFIQLNFVAVRTGVQFSTIVGQF